MSIRALSLITLVILAFPFSFASAQTTTASSLPPGYLAPADVSTLVTHDRRFGDSYVPWWPLLVSSDPTNAWYSVDYFSANKQEGTVSWGGRVFVNAKTGVISTNTKLYTEFGSLAYGVSDSTHLLQLITEELAASNAVTSLALASDYSVYHHEFWFDSDGFPYYRIDFARYDSFGQRLLWGTRALVNAIDGTIVSDPQILQNAQAYAGFVPANFDPVTKELRVKPAELLLSFFNLPILLGGTVFFLITGFLYAKFRRKIILTSVDAGFIGAALLELLIALILAVFGQTTYVGWLLLGVLGTVTTWITTRGMMRIGVSTQELRVMKPSEMPTFAEVGGMESVKEEIRSTVGVMLRYGDAARAMGVNFNGILLYGPPGTGKTFIARATAGEFGLNFISVKVSDMTSMYQAASTQLIANIFKKAEESAPCLLFFDEFDSVVNERSSGGLTTEDTRIVNQLLSSLEEIRSLRGKVIVMAATNNKKALDEAVIRPGRFDRQIMIPLPDLEARQSIIEHVLKDKPVAKNIDAAVLAHIAEGMSSAEIAAAIEKAIFDILKDSLSVERGAPDETPMISQEQLVDAFRNLYAREKQTVKWIGWDDLILSEETLHALKRLVELIENPDLTERIGIDAPRGVLLYGPPGTGKTTIARVIANEADASFSSISAADIYSKWMGESEQRIQKLFAEARKHKPSIIFIDEIDAMMRTRGGESSGYSDKITNQILQEIDGITDSSGVFIIGATNAPALIDPALLRGGRLSEKIEIPLPALEERVKLFELFLHKVEKTSDIDTNVLGAQTTGFSSADIKEVVKQAVLEAFEKGGEKVPLTQIELMRSIEKVMIGPERRSHPMSPHEKELTAYHEAGHAIIAGFLPGADPVQKITIVSRGDAGGYTLRLPEERSYYSHSQFLDSIAVSLGGYIAEKIVFGEVTTGPSSDLERLTRIARNMVLRYGMSEKLGAMVLDENDASVSARVDEEVRHIIDAAYEKAETILTRERPLLDRIAKRLLEVETIERAEFEQMLSEGRATNTQ